MQIYSYIPQHELVVINNWSTPERLAGFGSQRFGCQLRAEPFVVFAAPINYCLDAKSIMAAGGAWF